MSLTVKDMKREILRSGKDPVYFINNYAKISHPQKGTLPFKLFPFQQDVLRDFIKHRFNIILKARQLGMSTSVAAYCAWLMIFHKDRNILVVATQKAKAANIIKKVKVVFKNLPDWMMMSEVITNNKFSVELENGSQIVASSTGADAGRSEALSLLIVDEAAHVDGLDELWAGIYPTLSTGGRCIALSTPLGTGNWFHKFYIEAEQEANDFNPIKLMWDVHPERDEFWFQKETRNMSRRKIAQELECNFNASGDTVISPDDINKMKATIKDPLYKTGFDRNVWVWEDAIPGASYLAVADVSRGDGEDFSTVHVVKLETSEVVLEYKGKPSPDMFADMLFQIGKDYGACLIAIENAGVGWTVIEKLKEKEYPSVYHAQKHTHQYVEPFAADYTRNAVPGFSTTMKTRPLIVAKLEESIRNGDFISYSSRYVAELDTFIWYNGKAMARRGFNDDLIMASAICCWIKDTALVVNKRDLAYKMAFLNSMSKSTSMFDTKISGQRNHRKTQLEKKIENSEKHKELIDFGWVLKG